MASSDNQDYILSGMYLSTDITDIIFNEVKIKGADNKIYTLGIDVNGELIVSDD